MKNVRILALSKFSRWGGNAARYYSGFFYARKFIAVLHPCSLVVMASESPIVDFDNRKGSTVFLLPLKQIFLGMSKNTNNFTQAWARLMAEYGEQTPKQIKNSIFFIQNHLLQLPDTSTEEDAELQNAALDLKHLYVFMDEMETSINLKN